MVKNKRELAMFLGATHYCFNNKLTSEHFLEILSEYEDNHEGQTGIK